MEWWIQNDPRRTHECTVCLSAALQLVKSTTSGRVSQVCILQILRASRSFALQLYVLRTHSLFLENQMCAFTYRSRSTWWSVCRSRTPLPRSCARPCPPCATCPCPCRTASRGCHSWCRFNPNALRSVQLCGLCGENKVHFSQLQKKNPPTMSIVLLCLLVGIFTFQTVLASKKVTKQLNSCCKKHVHELSKTDQMKHRDANVHKCLRVIVSVCNQDKMSRLQPQIQLRCAQQSNRKVFIPLSTRKSC